MISPLIAPIRPIRRALAVAVALSSFAFAAGCQKVPLLAPSGSSITLTSSATALPLGGSTTIVAQVISSAGQAPHQGTQVTFTTTLGSIQPANAETDINGQAIVTYSAGNQSGMATITAISGGASVGSNGAVKIAVGTAAVGRVVVSANPATVSQLGGSTTITASVVDLNGNVLPNAAVNFTTTAGTLTAQIVNTDQNGNAQTVLTTAQQASVTASVGAQAVAGGGGTTGGGTTGGGTTGGGTTGGTGGATTTGQTSATVTVGVTASPTILITPPTTPPSAGLPSNYTVAVTVASGGAAVRNVTVNWGDGTVQQLGAISGSAVVGHTYTNAGNYVITATLTDAFGTVTPVSAPVTVVATALPTIVVNATSVPTVHAANMPVTFQAQVTVPSGITIQSASIDWGDAGPGGAPAPGDVNSLSSINGTVTLTHTYRSAGVFIVTLTVTDNLGRTPFGTTTVTLP